MNKFNYFIPVGMIVAVMLTSALVHNPIARGFDPLLCGNGVIDPGEACDDGNALNGDSCFNCQGTRCGDNVIDKPNYTGYMEECDGGANCTPTCRLANCGDGILQSGEVCDDGTADETGACPHCALAKCGDGYVAKGAEQCDLGAQNSDAGNCTTHCRFPVCGDGAVRAGFEQCDDGNKVVTDSCAECKPTVKTSWKNDTETGNSACAFKWRGKCEAVNGDPKKCALAMQTGSAVCVPLGTTMTTPPLKTNDTGKKICAKAKKKCLTSYNKDGAAVTCDKAMTTDGFAMCQ